ncbi:MAG: type 4a pilus biogenesis protein PilO [Candidatus Krumholzibacteriia bacterium]|nr:type 4a pilus biogenesis protein PilO [bacterium]MCB9514975.1 type 4a pilus biogenesis protein PilO [Candidatus Latescibacterota bacterium]
MNLQDPVIQRRAFTVLITLLLGYLFFGSTLLPFTYRVKKAQIARVDAELAEQERKLEIARGKAGRLEVLQARMNEMQADWTRLEALLPRTEEMPEFLKEIARLASTVGVKIDLLQPGQTVPGEGVLTRPIEMRVHGDYHKVGRFIALVANASRVIRTDGLTIRGLDDASKKKNVEGDAKDGSIEATFRATLYMMEGSNAVR